MPTGTPVLASLLAIVNVLESVRPAGRLLFVPAADPPPLVRPWHVWQAAGLVTNEWNRVALLQALPDCFASVAWQVKQSFPLTPVAPWFIH